MLWNQTVYSSQAQSVGYDEELGGMVVTWKNGKRSLYVGVSEELATQVANAPSVGSMLNAEIKPSYPHKYL